MAKNFLLKSIGKAGITYVPLLAKERLYYGCLPAWVSWKNINKSIGLSTWVQKRFEQNQQLHAQFFGKGYQDGDEVVVGERTYLLKITHTERKTHSAKLRNQVIHLFLSSNDSETHLQKSIQHLMSRVIAQDYMPEIRRRVNELNNLYFRQPVKSVNLKYNHSNWGSCSSHSNLNFSTRLLFAPSNVIDYVIIHELAHLIELNHSDRFWKLVSDAMPDYEEKEEWLKKNDHLCHF